MDLHTCACSNDGQCEGILTTGEHNGEIVIMCSHHHNVVPFSDDEIG